MSFVPLEQSKLHTLPYACVGVVQNLAPPMGVPGSGHVVAETKQVLNYWKYITLLEKWRFRLYICLL